MEILYESNKVEEYFRDKKKLDKKIQKPILNKLLIRIEQLKAYLNFKELLISGLGKPHKLCGNLENYYALELGKAERLIIKPIELINDNFDLVIKIGIKGVCDYHGGKIAKWFIP